MDIRIWELWFGRAAFLAKTQSLLKSTATGTTATFWATVVIALALILCFGRYAIGAECLSSDVEVRKVHGVTAWSTWRRVDGKKCWMEGTRHERVGRFDRIPDSGRRTVRRVRNRPDTLHTATSTEPEGPVRRLVLLETEDEVRAWRDEPEIKRRMWLISFQSWAMRQWADGWDNVYEARERYNGRAVHTEAVESRAISYSEIQKVRIIY